MHSRLPGSNPLATDDEELHCAFADLCDNLLPANSIDQYIADLAAFKSALQKTASDCSEPTSLHAFRSSRDKKSPELQAFPVNFHVQLLQVSDGTGELLGVAHSLTSGCMSTHMFSHAKVDLFLRCFRGRLTAFYVGRFIATGDTVLPRAREAAGTERNHPQLRNSQRQAFGPRVFHSRACKTKSLCSLPDPCHRHYRTIPEASNECSWPYCRSRRLARLWFPDSFRGTAVTTGKGARNG